MFLSKIRYKKETLWQIKHMNKVLHTKFSYVYCIEEAEFLSKIPKELDKSNKFRLEHLSKVLGLWHKGIIEDYYAHNKNNKNYDKIKPIFEAFLGSYIYELTDCKVIDKYDSNFDYSIDRDTYSLKFREYDYSVKNERIDDCKMLVSVLESFRKVVENEVETSSDEYLSKFVKFNYYGPMTVIYGYRNIKKNFVKYNRFYRVNPYNKMLTSKHLFRYNMLLNKCDRQFVHDKKKYCCLAINHERQRLMLECNRLESSDKRYDYYFDYFIFRLKNDVDFLFFKRLGGIKKVSELVNIHDKSKSVLDKTAISVDVDNMVIIDDKNNKSGSGGVKVTRSLDIKSFDNINKDILIREEQKEIRSRELGRRR